MILSVPSTSALCWQYWITAEYSMLRARLRCSMTFAYSMLPPSVPLLGAIARRNLTRVRAGDPCPARASLQRRGPQGRHPRARLDLVEALLVTELALGHAR